MMRFKTAAANTVVLLMCLLPVSDGSRAEDVRRVHRSENSVGVDAAKGGSITWLSFGDSGNVVNIADPGRLIQQSYYAGKSLDRTAQTQHPAWSPWPWNPIQGGRRRRVGDGFRYSSGRAPAVF